KQPSSPTESGEPCMRFLPAHRAPCRGAECSAPMRQSRASHQATETHHHPACETMCDMSVGTAVAGRARLLRASHVYGSVARPAKLIWGRPVVRPTEAPGRAEAVTVPASIVYCHEVDHVHPLVRLSTQHGATNYA